jgi:hypothetical protein
MPIEMNLPNLFLRRATVAFALFAGFFLIPAGRAQPESQIGVGRFLFIFDTSSDMKKRLPAVQAEVTTLLSSSLGGRLRAGDSLGVWTFDQDLRTGQFPLQPWRPDDAVTIASSINKLVGKQHYANNTRFNALQPQLNQLIKNSDRLTVLIFCDGEDEIQWTPYDAGINQVFQQRLAEQKRTRQPFVLVFRTQMGQSAGCTMNFPPGMVRVPEFPPPPEPPAPVKTPPPEPTPAPVVKPPPVGPPLIIIGTKVETNRPPPATNPAPMMQTNVLPAAPINPVVPTNPVAPPPPTNPVPAVQTDASPAPSAIPFAPTNPVAPKNPITPPPSANPAPAVQANAAPTTSTNSSPPANFPPVTPAKIVPIPPSNSTTPTNAVALPPEASSPDRRRALVIGGVLLIVAVALAALAVFRRRPDCGSLISRSMRKD